MSTEQPSEQAKPSEPKRAGRKWLWLFVVGGVVATVAGLLVNRYLVNPPLSPDDPPEKVYQQIFTAYGGQDALDRWKCGVVKYEAFADMELLMGMPGEAPGEMSVTQTFWLPRRFRQDTRSLGADKQVMAFGTDGTREWVCVNEGEVRIGPKTPNDKVHYPPFVNVYHPHAVLHSGADIVITNQEVAPDGRRFLAIETVGRDTPRTRCLYDVRTKLLHEIRRGVQPPFKATGEVRIEFADYQTTDGGPVPRRITTYLGERRIEERRFLSVEFRDSFEQAVFTPPIDKSNP